MRATAVLGSPGKLEADGVNCAVTMPVAARDSEIVRLGIVDSLSPNLSQNYC